MSSGPVRALRDWANLPAPDQWTDRATRVPEFPLSVSVQDVGRQEFDAVLRVGEEASDFQWLSLRCWNPRARLSTLGGALVVDFQDYHNPERRFYSFSGGDNPELIATSLLSRSEELGRAPVLRLVPESVARSLPSSVFAFTEDFANHDYVYSTHATKSAQGRDFQRLRRVTSTMERKFGDSVQVVNHTTVLDCSSEILVMAEEFLEERGYAADAVDEVAALTRCIEFLATDQAPEGVMISGLYLDTRLIAFSIDEVLSHSLAIGHFGHASRVVTDASSFLHRAVAIRLSDAGVEWLNDEQDLGHAGLRRHKKLNNPGRFVRKFDVALA